MDSLPQEQVHAYRAHTYHTLPELRLKNADQAVDFVNERGFVSFWPIKGLTLPSLWQAAAGDRPIPDNHDDPGHVTWEWKDSLLGKRRWYYARVLAHRNTLIALEMLPFFYALSENYGDYREDHIIQYQQGRLTLEAKSVYDALLTEGPLDTIALRKAARLANHESTGRFNKALDDLQRDFKVLPIGIAQAGAWHYAFIYELTSRHFPDLAEQARPITEHQARRELLQRYLHSVGAATIREICRCFSWTDEIVQKGLSYLVETQAVLQEGQIAGLKGDYYTHPDLLRC